MKISVSLAALFLISVNLACNKKHKATPQLVTVEIRNCSIVTPDPTPANEGDTIQWVVDPPDTDTYTITFKSSRRPVPNQSFPNNHQAQTVTPDGWCSAIPIDFLCTYKYSLTRIPAPSSGACVDPGVHVSPN